MSAHTPGPWVAAPVESGDGGKRALVYFRIQTRSHEANVAGTSVYCGKTSGATVKISEEECAANARLIAAAPDLLAACERIYEAHDRQDEDPSEEEWAALFEIIKDTIAKARGLDPKAVADHWSTKAGKP